MDAARWSKVKAIVAEAIELPSGDRARVVRERCGDDDELLREVESLLAAHDDLGPDEAPDDDVPEQIGPYRILERIGSGGMGEVWLAEQRRPVRRRVALKVIKRGMDTDQVIARFEAERQALALMNHPHVAKVLDAGATDRGRPYFVMEYVEGVPITEYCDRHRLTTRERLALLVQVCEGVQHAHQKGIIHRDVKPSNVLVETIEGRHVPKIIDFGVAKATAQRLTERTAFTELGQLVGTIEYMAPEQADPGVDDVDTRADVYSIGVLLYELLTGLLPLDAKELRAAGFDEIRRRIRTEDPSRPSTRIGTLGDAAADPARRRRTDPAALSRQLRGDLDWITMRALDKDRGRRYGSPAELAADIERHLTDQAVLAGPPSFTYRAAKFTRRHRMGVSVAAFGVVGLVIFGVTMAVLARKIDAERSEAEAARDDLERVVDFQSRMLREVDADGMGRRLFADLRQRVERGLGRRGISKSEMDDTVAVFDDALGTVNATDVALRLIDDEILDRAGSTIGDRFGDQPLVDAELRKSIGQTYRTLGMYDRARPYLESALASHTRELGEEHPRTLSMMDGLGQLLQLDGEFGEAEAYHRAAVDGLRRTLGDDHPDTLTALGSLATVLEMQDKLDEAEALLLENLDRSRRVLGVRHEHTLTVINNIG